MPLPADAGSAARIWATRLGLGMAGSLLFSAQPSTAQALRQPHLGALCSNEWLSQCLRLGGGMSGKQQGAYTMPEKPSFHVFDVSLDLIRCLRDLIARVREHDGDLAKQLRRAAASVPLNISEGNRRRGKDRRYLWLVAAGSADEVRSCLLIAAAWGYLEDDYIEEPIELIERILAMLWKLTH